jgi:parvulin-like peptidyl-prolyl isomerase
MKEMINLFGVRGGFKNLGCRRRREESHFCDPRQVRDSERRLLQVSGLGALLLLLALTSSAAAEQPVDTNAPTAARPRSRVADLFPDTVVAKGQGVEVKRSQLDEEFIRFKSQAAAERRGILPEQLPLVERELLDSLIQVQLMVAKASDDEKATNRSLAEKQLEEIKARLGSTEALNRRLRVERVTREELISKWADRATAEAVAKRELKVKVSDEEVKKFYNDNPSRFETPELVRASHILLLTRDMTANPPTDLPEDKKAAKRKLIQELLKRARGGEDFAKLAREYSEDDRSKDRGGELLFPRGQMVPEFEAAAFSLKTNQISDMVTSQYGYHIIKLSERIPAQKAGLDDEVAFTTQRFLVIKNRYPPQLLAAQSATNAVFAKLSSLILQDLEGQARQRQAPEYLARLKKEAGVEILDPRLKAIELPVLPSGQRFSSTNLSDGLELKLKPEGK